MHFIFFLIGLFLISCMFYGIHCGVSVIARGLGKHSQRPAHEPAMQHD
jgi:hypothetical protein